MHFRHRIIGKMLSGKMLSGEVTPNHMHTDLQTNLRMIRYYPCSVHTGSTLSN